MILILAKHEVEKQREPGKEQTVADLQQEMMEHHKVVLKCLLKKNPPGDPKIQYFGLCTRKYLGVCLLQCISLAFGSHMVC